MASVIKLYYLDLNTAFSVLGINERDVKFILDIERLLSHLQNEDFDSTYRIKLA